MCVFLNYIVKSTFDIDTQHNAETWVRKEEMKKVHIGYDDDANQSGTHEKTR